MEFNFFFLLFQLLVLIFSVMIHEISHGFIAEKLGDDTARLAGRLTLNPIKHVDPIGSFLLPALLFFSGSPVILGWAKPVPYNPFKLSKDPKYGPLKVALAGPVSNLIVLFVFGLIARFGIGFLDPKLIGLFGFIALLNAFLAVFNLIPIPPLDGSKIFSLLLPSRYFLALESMSFSGLILIFVFIFFFSRVIYFLASFLFVIVAGAPAASVMEAALSSL